MKIATAGRLSCDGPKRELWADPHQEADTSRLLAWADAAVAELQTCLDPSPATPREWSIWQAGQHAGFLAGYEHGRHRLFDERDEADQRAWLTWLATQNVNTYGGIPARDDPRFRRWREQRDRPQKRR